eukprot:1915444-Amphidinium_carterae.2
MSRSCSRKHLPNNVLGMCHLARTIGPCFDCFTAIITALLFLDGQPTSILFQGASFPATCLEETVKKQACLRISY